jgi:hypothetical protein
LFKQLVIARRPAYVHVSAVLHTLFEHLRSAHSDPSVKAVVIRGDGANFSAGYDINQFLSLGGLDCNTDLTALVEHGAKPTVAGEVLTRTSNHGQPRRCALHAHGEPRVLQQSKASRWAVAWSWRWRAVRASRRRTQSSGSPSCSWESSPAWAARSGCRGWRASLRRWT